MGHSRRDSLCVSYRAAWQTSTADPSLPVGAALCFSVWRLFDKRKKRAGDSDMGRSPIWGAVGVTLFGLVLGSLVRTRSRGFNPGFRGSWWGAMLAPAFSASFSAPWCAPSFRGIFQGPGVHPGLQRSDSNVVNPAVVKVVAVHCRSCHSHLLHLAPSSLCSQG